MRTPKEPTGTDHTTHPRLGPPRVTISLVVASVLVLAAAVTLQRAGSDAPERGHLTVQTHPPVGAQILVDGVVRNADVLHGLPLEPGSYTVCFEEVVGYLAPACEPVRIEDGGTTEVTATYEPAGNLHVTTDPPDLSPQIEVDGIARDAGSITLPVAAGRYEVCVEEVAGFEPIDCVEVDVVAGEEVTLELTFEPVG